MEIVYATIAALALCSQAPPDSPIPKDGKALSATQMEESGTNNRSSNSTAQTTSNNGKRATQVAYYYDPQTGQYYSRTTGYNTQNYIPQQPSYGAYSAFRSSPAYCPT